VFYTLSCHVVAFQKKKMNIAVKRTLLAASLFAVMAGHAAQATQPKDLPKPTSQLGAPVSLTPQVPAGAIPPPLLSMPAPAGQVLAPATMIAVTLVQGIDHQDMTSEQAKHYPGLPVVLEVTTVSDILPPALAAGAQCRITAEGGVFGNASRPYFVARALSCFDHRGRTTAQGRIEGYVVGSDSVLGLRNLDDVKVGTKATVVMSVSSILRLTPQ
jgi:hypothetical protein